MKIKRHKIIIFVLTLGFLYPLYLGYKYYIRSTYLPVRYPFISANGFRQLANHFFDQPQKYQLVLWGTAIDPKQVKDGDIIFIKNDPYYLEKFFTNAHPYITSRYVLVSFNSDSSVPGPFARYLNDDKLIAWCSMNIDATQHPKLIRLPIGLCGILNVRAPYNWEEIWGKILIDIQNGQIKKDKLVYCNMNVKTNIIQRQEALKSLKDKSFCVIKPFNRPYDKYLREMGRFKFVVSPHGAGFDCYRTWEALTIGCIPIVKKSCIDSLYDGLPVLIVDSWDQVTEEFLEQQYKQISQKTYKLERLRLDYWIDFMKKRIEQLTNKNM